MPKAAPAAVNDCTNRQTAVGALSFGKKAFKYAGSDAKVRLPDGSAETVHYRMLLPLADLDAFIISKSLVLCCLSSRLRDKPI